MSTNEHWIGFEVSGKVYGPANPEMQFPTREEAIEFALEEGLGELEHWVGGDRVDADTWSAAPTLAEATAAAIRSALESRSWRLLAAAKALDVTPGRLRRLIRDCGLSAEYAQHNPGRGRPAGSTCACGCGKRTARMVRRLREQDRNSAASLGWAEMSIAPMREAIPCVRGHESSLPDVVDESSR
jgi:hypothetical protein